MTGTWRDTLFVWQGLVEPAATSSSGSNKANAKDKYILNWKGSWVGCKGCPDARTAPTPNEFAFRLSSMKFQVCTKTAAKKNGDFWCYDMTSGSGWDLGEGNEKARHKDRHHVISSREDFSRNLPSNNNEIFVVVAKGDNDFGSFISAGYLETAKASTNIVLTLGRRYLEDGDARAKWTLEELYERIAATDRGFTCLSTACENIKIRVAPWRTKHLHAREEISPSRQSGSKGKRKRASDAPSCRDVEDEGDDNDQLPPLNIPRGATGFNPAIVLAVKETEYFTRFELVSHVRWLGQCNGCGTELPHDKNLICNDIMMWIKDEEIPEPETSFSLLYCTEDCVKAIGAKAWADASRIWRDHDACHGYFLRLSEDEQFCKIVENDERLLKFFKDIGWETGGEWELDGAGPDDSEINDDENNDSE